MGRKALTDDLSLDDLIKYARSMERTYAQAKIIENKHSDSTINKIGKPGRYSQKCQNTRSNDGIDGPDVPSGLSCYFCGDEYPHSKDRKSCPAYGKKCNHCKLLNHFAKCCTKRKQVNKVEQNTGFEPNTEFSDSSDDQYSPCIYIINKKST